MMENVGLRAPAPAPRFVQLQTVHPGVSHTAGVLAPAMIVALDENGDVWASEIRDGRPMGLSRVPRNR